jgi:hypothetical protein
LLVFNKKKIKKNIIAFLQNKNLSRLQSTPGASVKFNFPEALNKKLDFNYLEYPICN